LWKDGEDLAGFPALIGRVVAIAQADDRATLSGRRKPARSARGEMDDADAGRRRAGAELTQWHAKVIVVARLTQRWKQWAGQLKIEVYAIYVAYRDPRVPWVARVFAACVVAYAFSPLDLIPDPIPILGYVDDLILIPLGIKLALSMIPAEVMAESREKAREIMRQGKPVNRAVAAVIVVIWLLLAALIITVLAQIFSR
jgi:uncharacterized membrane protein YkvA (DUF1232 family)